MTRKEYARQYREHNKARLAYFDYVRREQRRKDLMEAIGGVRCVDCGIDDYVLLQFDHVYGKTKEVNCILTCKWETALAEAKLCEVVCANCHVRRTYERRPKPPEELTTVWV